jgi:arylformamidase
LIDISVPLQNEMPFWPRSEGFSIEQVFFLERDGANVSAFRTDVHAGTHIDAPLHIFPDGGPLESIPLTSLIGPAEVVDLPGRKMISAEELKSVTPDGTERLLIRTDNSRLWKNGVKTFQEDFVALTVQAVQWIVDQGILAVGVDYLSIQSYKGDRRVHEILLSAKVTIIEGLNLSDAPPGHYELICLPIRLLGVDGAPARAVLRELPQEETR